MNGLMGTKIGMTQIFADGTLIPVTVIEVGPCPVVQRKTAEADGYDAVQLGFGDQKEERLTKPLRGHFKKAEVSGKSGLREFRIDAEDEAQVGDHMTVALFEGTPYVDITAMSKGRGFQGVVKRWNMGGGHASHGSGFHRRIGSIGQCVQPARVLKNKKLPGQMGAKKVTVQHLKVVQVRPDENILLVRGAVPGPKGGRVTVRKSIKKKAVSS